MPPRVRFNKPPVIEVVCGVLFEKLTKFLVPHVGLYWLEIGAATGPFPRLAERPILAEAIEPPELQPSAGTRIEFLEAELPRIWFQASDDSRLIQLQRDRFLYNWKRRDDAFEYPSYDDVIKQFELEFSRFSDFLRAHELGTLEERQYELTYVNHIPIGTERAAEEDPLIVLNDHRRDVSRDRFLPEPETYQWRDVYRLPGGVGRLHIVAQRAQRIDSRTGLMRLELTARGFRGDAQNRRQWFDLAHDWITHGFADVTSAAAQQRVWMRTQ